MTTERVPLPRLKGLVHLGAPLPFRILDDHGRLLLAQGQLIDSEEQLEALSQRGAWVERWAAEAERQRRDLESGAGAALPTSKHQLSLFDQWEQQVLQFDPLLRNLARGVPGVEPLIEYSGQLAALIERDPDVALFMTIRPPERKPTLYPQSHAVQCATVVHLAALALGWPVSQALSVLRAALTMNVGMLELQAILVEQRERPGTRQVAQIRAHPAHSVDLLRAAGVDDASWLEAVQQHHERPGGGGYPDDLAEPAQSARLLRLADLYLAKITPRAQRPAIGLQLAARHLLEQESDRKLFLPILQGLGIYPPGDWVRLKNGEIGVVARRASNGIGPIVATMTDDKGKPVTTTHRRDTAADPAHAIAGTLTGKPPMVRVLPERVYGML